MANTVCQLNSHHIQAGIYYIKLFQTLLYESINYLAIQQGDSIDIKLYY